jgi:hypothetical protein
MSRVHLADAIDRVESRLTPADSPARRLEQA